MNILLVQCMHEKAEAKERTSFNFPWGLAHLASFLTKAGYRVQILDAHALQMPKEEVAKALPGHDADVVGLSAFSTQYPAVRLLSEVVKERMGLPVVVGGPLATYQPELVLRTTRADYCVVGEGEITTLELLNSLDDPVGVKGVAYRREGQVCLNPPQDRLVNLDELPVPNFGLFDMELYLKQQNSYARRGNVCRAITVISSRGCPYSCHFCSKSSRAFRAMSPASIYSLLAMLKREFGVEEISFGDELFLSSKKKFQELAPRLKSLNIAWGGQARVNLMDEEFLNMIKGAGCVGLGYGIESGSQKILNNMNKKITVSQIEQVMTYTQKLGIPVKVQLIFGYPGEDETTVQETIDLFDRIDHPGRRFNVITPIPGSKLYDDCLAEGLIKDEPAYLGAIEKSFGIGKVHVNFTPWPDDEVYPRKQAAEKTMVSNYLNKSLTRRLRYRAAGLKRRLFG